jgi:hypothetical protein
MAAAAKPLLDPQFLSSRKQGKRHFFAAFPAAPRVIDFAFLSSLPLLPESPHS